MRIDISKLQTTNAFRQLISCQGFVDYGIPLQPILRAIAQKIGVNKLIRKAIQGRIPNILENLSKWP